jgi:hypothetical protein
MAASQQQHQGSSTAARRAPSHLDTYLASIFECACEGIYSGWQRGGQETQRDGRRHGGTGVRQRTHREDGGEANHAQPPTTGTYHRHLPQAPTKHGGIELLEQEHIEEIL